MRGSVCGVSWRGDFDGDGVTDLAAAGPEKGVRHYRGLGDGTFAVVGDLPALEPTRYNFPKPVYVMKAVRSRDGRRDDVVVSHANSDRTWILSSQPTVQDADRVVPGAYQELPVGASEDTPIVITEFSASNEDLIEDEDGDSPDWIELYNRSDAPVLLAEWSLADSLDEGAQRWKFPAVTLQPGHFLVVFASGKNRAVPGTNLHTSFKLGSRGESLALHRPDGERVQRFPEPEGARERLNPASPLAVSGLGFRHDEELADGNGQYWDYVVVQNRSNSPIEAPFWSLVLNQGNPWTPPEGFVLAAGESVPVFFSGSGVQREGELHGPAASVFKGSVELMDQFGVQSFHLFDWRSIATEFPPQVTDVSYGLGLNGGAAFFDEPTPGSINNAGVDDLSDFASHDIVGVEIRKSEHSRIIWVDASQLDEQLLTPEYIWFCYDVGLQERHIVLQQAVEEGKLTQDYFATIPG